MSIFKNYKMDPKLDLSLELSLDVPPELVWKAWTDPEGIKQWFCPKPWYVSECRMDLRPGGEFFTAMNGPNGEKMPNAGCFLEVTKNEVLAWTDGLFPGYRFNPNGFFTGAVVLAPEGKGTKYTAYAIHGNEETRKRHEQMGFREGWGVVAQQMIEHIKKSR